MIPALDTNIGTNVMVKKRELVSVKGQPILYGGALDFGEYERTKGWEGIIEDMKSGRFPAEKKAWSDVYGNGLRVLVRRTGTVSYYCQYRAPEPPASLDLDEDEKRKRGHITLGHYPHTPVEIVRNRAMVITKLAEMGQDVKWGLRLRLLHEIDEKGLKWRFRV